MLSERRLFMDFFDLHCDTITTAMHHSVGFDCDHLDISFPKLNDIRSIEDINGELLEIITEKIQNK